MNDKTLRIYNNFGRISFWVALAGVICYILYFPQGIYYCFFCGVFAVALAVTAKKNSPNAHFIGGVIVGIIDVGMACMAFYGLYLLYTALSDPSSASQMNEFITDMLSEYGIPIEVFSQMLHR